MPTYFYRVKDSEGRAHVGLAEAVNKAEVKARLREEGMYFLSCRRCDRRKIFNKRVKFEDLLMFTQRLTALIEAGIPILQGLKVLWRQTEDHTMQLVISHLRDELEAGTKISDALGDFPRIFSPMYIALIAVAETGGDLVHVLRQLSAYHEYLHEVIHRTKKAVFYPLIVIVFSFFVISGLFVFVVPTFGRVLGKLDADLPFLTEMVMAVSAAMRTGWFWLGFAAAAAGVFFLYRFLSRHWTTARILDGVKLRIPYIGKVYEAVSLSRFVRSFGLLLGAGVPALTALETASKTLVNRRLEGAVLEIQHEVEQGASLHEAFLHQRCFPVMLVEMIGIGESSGTLVRILERMTRYFDLEMDYRINRLLTALEPGLIIVVGGVVTVTLLAIYLPIVTLWNSLMGY